MHFIPVFPNPNDDEAQRRARLEAQVDDQPRRSLGIFVAGWLMLVAFGVLAVVGLPGAGLVLVPVGIGMILGAGIELIIHRLGS